jgi:hypothetical protein
MPWKYRSDYESKESESDGKYDSVNHLPDSTDSTQNKRHYRP